MLTLAIASFLSALAITAPVDITEAAAAPVTRPESQTLPAAVFAVNLPSWFVPTLLGKTRFEALEEDAKLPENKTGFRLTLVEVGAKGALSEQWSYRFVLNAALEVTPLDFYGEYQPLSKLKVRAGQFKIPFGRQEISRTGELVLPDRAALAQLAPNRDTGIMVHGDLTSWLAYSAGTFNGEGRNLARNINNSFLNAGRIVITPYGQRSDTGESLRKRNNGLSLGVNAGHNIHGDLQNAREILWGADVSFLSRRFGFIGEYGEARFSPPASTRLGDYRKRGFYLQPIYMAMLDRWEWVIRYERFDPNTTQSGLKEQNEESIWLGTNLYLDDGRETIQLAYGKHAELEGLESNNNQIILQLQVRLE